MMTIRQWPLNERPREKLLQRGAEALSDAELIAIFLRHGRPGKTAIDLAREMLVHFQGLGPLLETSVEQLTAFEGIGTAKYAELQASLEIGRRYLQERLSDAKWIQNSNDTRNFIKARLRRQQREVFACLFLDNQHRIISYEELFFGTLHTAMVYPREIVKRALMLNAGATILVHNHPSGSTQPSDDDVQLTQHIRRSLQLVDVRVIDHMIVAGCDIPSGIRTHRQQRLDPFLN